MLKNQNIQTRILLSVCSVVFISLLLFGISSYLITSNIIDNLVDNNLKQILETTNLTVSTAYDLESKYTTNKKEMETKVLKAVRDKLLSVKIGTTGYIYVFDSKGVLRLHPKIEGKDLYNTPDASGFLFVQEITKNKNGHMHYVWKNPGEEAARPKIAYYKYFPELDWIIIAGSYEEEFYGSINTLRNTMLIIGIISMLIMIFVILLLSKNIANIIKKVVIEIEKLTRTISDGNLEIRGDLSLVEAEFRPVMKGINNIMEEFVKPINVTAEYIHRISIGDIPEKITEEYKGDFKIMKNNLNKCIDAINLLIHRENIILHHIVDGNLNARVDTSNLEGDYKKITEGMNLILDAIIAPLNVAAEYIDRISKGDIPPQITETYKGDFNEIKNNLNVCMDAINALIRDANMLTRAAADGKFSTRADERIHYGDFRKIIEGVNNTLNAIVNPMTILIEDVNVLTRSAIDGNLNTRTDASRHQGEFRKVIDGVNSMLDAVAQPLKMTSDYLSRIAKGDIPSKITANYNGDFNEIKDSLNICIDAINSMQMDVKTMCIAALEGKLKVRVDASRHQGDFFKIVNGLNDVMNSITGPLNTAVKYMSRIASGDIPPKISESYSGDFNDIKDSANQCIDAINRLIDDTDMLVKAAHDGRLSTRADVTKHTGDYKKIVNGINNTLDEFIDPVAEAVKCLKAIADGNLAIRMQGNYQGDHAIMKESLNQALESFNDIMSQVEMTTRHVVTSSQQISDSSQSLSQGATEQASSVEEITSSMTELGSQITLNAENANQANNLTMEARKSADVGNSQMTDMVTAMSEIATASNNISKIIKVIDEIAFQTNLLALNAAVEAARAGRHGKGFAVVAEEVRNLAARSATAAKETAELIENSIKKAENGSDTANKTAHALTEIVNTVTKVTDLVGEIAIASNEQAQGVGHINQGLTHIEKVTQQNAAYAEESAASAETLNSQAYILQDMLGKFRLSGQVEGASIHSSRDKMLPPPPKMKPKSTKIINPTDVIALDDEEFGKY